MNISIYYLQIIDLSKTARLEVHLTKTVANDTVTAT